MMKLHIKRLKVVHNLLMLVLVRHLSLNCNGLLHLLLHLASFCYLLNIFQNRSIGNFVYKDMLFIKEFLLQ